METTRVGPRGAGSETGARQAGAKAPPRRAEAGTRPRRAGWAALAAGLSAVVRSGGAGSGQASPLDRAALRRAVAGLPPGDVTGALVRVAGADGHWWGTAGTGDVATGERVRADGVFRTGGIGALFTAALVLRLVGEGLLSLEAPVRAYLPDLLPGGPEGYDAVTVGMLLDHTSGFPGPRPPITEDGPPAGRTTERGSRFRTQEEAVRAVLRGGRAFEPGRYQRENDVDTWVAGLVVERATGRPLGEEIRTRVTRPLGLHRTHQPADGTALVGRTRRDPAIRAEGGPVSTAADLDRFLDALLGGRLLGPAQQRLLFELPGRDVTTLPGAGGTAAPEAPPHRFSRGGLMRVALPDDGLSDDGRSDDGRSGGGTVVWGRVGAGPGYVNGLVATRDRTRRLACSLTWAAPPGRSGERHVHDLIRAAFTAAPPDGR
ncbi:serine hydrolase domain-containing protein [Streptomyces huiliensis]|uniref:serine hydrolase domain-containing protein n=1 Tax=Streptomyces huiliensis TaxID=2876027 RepID=UPI001CC12BC3|nr:serine hydrolase domain-containing protein [Streptomyces huiliensis]MBZ4324205.1 beta-lactamase family protein [Streptomyces huiliensis]